jgi:hypothetical protein
LNVDALRVRLEFLDVICDGYFIHSLYGDEGDWMKYGRIDARDREVHLEAIPPLCAKKLKASTTSYLCDAWQYCNMHKGVTCTLAKALTYNG